MAWFIEALHLTYDEVVNKIPYRQLVLMNTDKLRIDDEGREEGKKYVSGREMLKRKVNGRV